MVDRAAVLRLLSAAFPDLQAIYAFGSHGTKDERPNSDVDVALLLPHRTAQRAGNLAMGELHRALERASNKDVDLINLRLAPTVLQHEIVNSGSVLCCADEVARQTFEMLVWSFYQKLNEERSGVLQEGLKRGRFYDL